MTRLFLAALLAAPAFAQGVEAGRKQFEVGCGGCHGADGAGGERGPGIVEARRGRPRSRQSLRDTIRNGIPGSGMPAFSLADVEMNSILDYLQFLTQPASERPAPDDGPTRLLPGGRSPAAHHGGGRLRAAARARARPRRSEGR